MRLDILHGLFEGTFPVKIIEQFLIAHRVEGVEFPVGIERPRLFEQSLLHHLVHAAGDAVEEHLAGPVEVVFLDVKVAFLRAGLHKRGVGFAHLEGDFQGTAHPFVVVGVHHSGILRVKELELGAKGLNTVVLIKVVHIGTGVGVRVGQLVDALADGVDILRTAAGHHHDGMG